MRISNGNVIFCEFQDDTYFDLLTSCFHHLYMNKSHSQLYPIRIEYPKMVSEHKTKQMRQTGKQQTANGYEDNKNQPMKS